MDVDPSRIPVDPIPLEHGLVRFAQGIAAERIRIVAIGSSTTAGEGNITPYPARLKALLDQQYPNVRITVANKGKGGEDAPAELKRFDKDVIAEKPDLVIWQVGTNTIWQPPSEHPPSFEETTRAIRDGLAKLRDKTQADVILMDLQYLPGVLTPAKQTDAIMMVEAISKLAAAAGVNLFRRFAFMKGLVEVEQVSIDRMVDPTDPDRLHMSDWMTDRLTRAMQLAISQAVERAAATSS